MATYGVASVRLKESYMVDLTNILPPGHCHLMMDNLQDAYSAYQQALYFLRDPKVSFDILPNCTVHS